MIDDDDHDDVVIQRGKVSQEHEELLQEEVFLGMRHLPSPND